ncbi:hypothetical protein ILUMI_07034 [Ignelater luminosus]|uniref:Protein sleepless n=1 Tax=Ignelater luminosus TaxID=2038154 RepID=A0A8K0DEB3_IGNLU|nr:hypothetical protein ILUMI_07034 [Ignelater luminosus]
MNNMFKCILVFVAVFISTGYALNCYTCKSDRLSRCTKGSSEMVETQCGVEHPPLLRFCIFKIVYDNVEKKETVEAGCEEMRKDVIRVGKELVPAPLTRLDRNIQQCQSNERLNISFCEPCNKDLCNFVNSASISKMNIHRFCTLLLLYIFANSIFR